MAEFSCSLETSEKVAKITLEGELDASVADRFRDLVEQAAASEVTRLVLFVQGLQYMASAGLRVLVYAKQKMGSDVEVYVIGPQDAVLQTLQLSGFHQSVYIQDAYSGE